MRRLPFIFCCIVLFASCGPDESDLEASLDGQRWVLKKALRNNMETEMLDGLYYEFRADSTVQTNLLGEEQRGKYTLDETNLALTGVLPKLDYAVTELTDSTLHLRTELQGFRFDFLMTRALEETPAGI